MNFQELCNINLHILFAGGKDGIVNPMVNNMVPAYDNAKYDTIWVSTSRIKGKMTAPLLL